MSVPTLEDLGDVDGRRVLLRADFNVPIADGDIVDDFRIRAALPTIEWLTERGATVTACTHLGRPKGAPDPKYSVEPVRARLAELAPGVELLDNLRFDPGETANDPAFVQTLIAGQDLYVNDAFGASHRAHASIVGPPQFLPSAAGRLLQREVEVLLPLRTDPKRPFVVILGGSKVSDKLGVIDALLEGRRRPDHRRRHVLHVPRRPGPLGRVLAARGGPDRDLPAAARLRRHDPHPARHHRARPGRQDR